MNRGKLLERLDKATDKAAAFAIQRGNPLSVTKKSTLIGTTIIEKNSSGMYDVMSFDKVKLFENISVFDVAIIVAQRYVSGETGAVKQVLYLEEKFLKYHLDMIHYLRCMRSAKKNRDHVRLAILEDKFQLAEQKAKDTRDRIAIFKRVK